MSVIITLINILQLHLKFMTVMRRNLKTLKHKTNTIKINQTL